MIYLRSRSLYAIARPSVVWLSSVCNVGAPYSAGWNFRQYCFTTGTLVFWCQKSLVGTPLSSWNLSSKWPTPFQTAQFRPISAHSASIVIASEQSSISTYRKSTTRFPTSHRWTVYVTPQSPKGWHKNEISKKVCCKVSLCENFQRQSCSYIIPLSNGP